MKFVGEIRNNKIITPIDMPNGKYDISVKEKDQSKTIEQLKKLWATIDDISKAQYGNVSQSDNIYFQILNMSGIKTYKALIQEEALKPLKAKVRAVSVIANEVIDHIPYVLVNVCVVGVSEMSKKELSSVIETTIQYASEVGVSTELER